MYFNFKIPPEEYKKLLLGIGEEGANFLKEEYEAKKSFRSTTATTKPEEVETDENGEVIEEEIPDYTFPEIPVFDKNVDPKVFQNLLLSIGEEGAEFLKEEYEAKKSFRSTTAAAKPEEVETDEEGEVIEEEIPDYTFPEIPVFDKNVDPKVFQNLLLSIGEEGAEFLKEEYEAKKSFRSTTAAAKPEEVETDEEGEVIEEEIPDYTFPEIPVFDKNVDPKVFQNLLLSIGEEGAEFLKEEYEAKKSFRSTTAAAKPEEVETDENGEVIEEEIPDYTFPEIPVFNKSLTEDEFKELLEKVGEEGKKYLDEDEEKQKQKYKKKYSSESESEESSRSPFPEGVSTNSPFPDGASSNSPFPDSQDGEEFDESAFGDIDEDLDSLFEDE